MSKKKQLKQAHEEIFSAKQFLIQSAKRYGIILLIVTPIMLFFNYYMSLTFEWYTSTLSFVVCLVMLLTACLIGLIIFTKKDDKKKQLSTKETERDPFAD